MADNFTPGETVSLTAGASSATVSFSLAQSAIYPDVMVTNAGANVAFIGFSGGGANTPGPGALNATAILAGETMTLRKGVGVAQCCAISPSGTTLYFTAGEGS